MERDNINFDRYDFRSYMNLHNGKEMQLSTLKSFMTNQRYNSYIDESFVEKVRNYYIKLDNSLLDDALGNQEGADSNSQEEAKISISFSDTESTENTSMDGDLFAPMRFSHNIPGIDMNNEKYSPSTIKANLNGIPSSEESGIAETKKVVECY